MLTLGNQVRYSPEEIAGFQRRAYLGGRVDAQLGGRVARDPRVAEILTFDGEAAVCYLNGVDDFLAGL